MKVLILTTATNRPDLHSDSFESYRRFIDPHLDVTWLINLDYIPRFGSDLNYTERNIRDIFKGRDIDFKFIHNKVGWMNKAVRNLIDFAEPILDDFDCVVYLEDDWLYENYKGITLLDTFDFDVKGGTKRLLGKKFINLLSKRIQVKDVTFQPTIWSIPAFKEFCKIINSSEDYKSCPETIIEQEYDTRRLIKFQYPLFKDIGRSWLKDKGMSRPKKEDLGMKNPNYSGNNMETYKEYITRCQNKPTGWDVSMFTLDVNGERLGVELPPNYDEIINSICNGVVDRLESGNFENDSKGNVSKVLDEFSIEGVNELGEWFAKELSEKLYGGECFINHVHPYRNNIEISDVAPTWMWHYDNVAPGIIKILVYLTDTTSKTGAFLALKDDDDTYVLIEPSEIAPYSSQRPKWPKSRVPRTVIKEYKMQGFKEHHIEGPKGTFIVFNNNIVHRATNPVEEPERMCLIYHFRPYHKKLDHHIGKDITWGWKSKVNSKTFDFDIIETGRWKEIMDKKKK